MSPNCPEQHRDLVRAPAGTRHEVLAGSSDPLARLLDASLLVMRQEAEAATLTLATETASSQGWRQPLLTYLKLQQKQAAAQGNAAGTDPARPPHSTGRGKPCPPDRTNSNI